MYSSLNTSEALIHAFNQGQDHKVRPNSLVFLAILIDVLRHIDAAQGGQLNIGVLLFKLNMHCIRAAILVSSHRLDMQLEEFVVTALVAT